MLRRVSARGRARADHGSGKRTGLSLLVRTGLSLPVWRIDCAGFLVHAFSVLLLTASASLAGTWQETDVPAYAKSTEILAIGSDGAFYSVSSNRHGFFFQALLETYRFEKTASEGRTGGLLRRQNVVFLADSCDGYTADASGRWSLGAGGKTYRLTVAGGEITTFHLLSGDPEPRHSC